MPAIKIKNGSGKWERFPLARGKQGEMGPAGPRGAPTRVNGKEGEDIELTVADIAGAASQQYVDTAIQTAVIDAIGGSY